MKNVEKLLLENIELFLAVGHDSGVVEEATATLMDDMGNSTIKVSVNPTTEAVVYMLDKLYPNIDPNDDWSMKKLGGIKFNEEFCFWDRDDSSHNNIAYQLGYKKDFIGFYLFPVFNETDDTYQLIDVNILVTKFSGMGKYDFTKATKELLDSDIIISLKNAIKNKENINIKDKTHMY